MEGTEFITEKVGEQKIGKKGIVKTVSIHKKDKSMMTKDEYNKLIKTFKDNADRKYGVNNYQYQVRIKTILGDREGNNEKVDWRTFKGYNKEEMEEEIDDYVLGRVSVVSDFSKAFTIELSILVKN